MTATTAPAVATAASRLDTIPKLLLQNAKQHASRPAFREKAFGIWQTWTWQQTKDEIQRAIPEMIRNLGEAGIHIKKLEVVLTNQQSYDNAKDQSFNASQNGNPSQQNQPESGQTSGGTNQNQWKTNIANSSKFDQQQGYHTDKSIDMLA